jgi:hypothetical protein
VVNPMLEYFLPVNKFLVKQSQMCKNILNAFLVFFQAYCSKYVSERGCILCKYFLDSQYGVVLL